MVSFKGFYAGVGSRDTPSDIESLMIRIGRVLCDLGWGLSSGDALSADRKFYEGAKQSTNYYHIPQRIYLAWDGIGDRYHNPSEGFLDATRFTDTYETAMEMAREARGSFERLGRGGIALHTRNVFQIHGHDLQELVLAMIYWAVPVGKHEKVKGGTNTALQLAITANVPHRINLYTDEGRKRAERFLEQYEKAI